MRKIVVDSSVIIEYIRTKRGMFLDLLYLSKAKKVQLYIPTIVILELWKGKSMSSVHNQKVVKDMIKQFKIITLSRQLATKSAEIVRDEIILDSEDAIIAATALYLDAHLATQNIKHFKKVSNLKIFKK